MDELLKIPCCTDSKIRVHMQGFSLLGKRTMGDHALGCSVMFFLLSILVKQPNVRNNIVDRLQIGRECSSVNVTLNTPQKLMKGLEQTMAA